MATIGRTYLVQAFSQETSSESSEANKKAEKAFVMSLKVCEELKKTLKVEDYMAMRCRLFLNLGQYILFLYIFRQAWF